MNVKKPQDREPLRELTIGHLDFSRHGLAQPFNWQFEHNDPGQRRQVTFAITTGILILSAAPGLLGGWQYVLDTNGCKFFGLYASRCHFSTIV
jgi:hypothetical protein